MTHLFLFTISPVQSFIAQARKTQDLYAGSRILSDLVREGMRTILKINGKIIFPFVENETDLDKLESLPNRFVAEIDCLDITDEKEINAYLHNLGKEQVEKNVRQFFEDKAFEIFNDIVKVPKKELVDSFTKQITQHLDIHWLFLKRTNSYANDFKKIEQLLGAIKNTRTFEQNAETGRKCSLDGERNALFCAKGSKSKLQLKPMWANLDEIQQKAINDFNNSITEIHKGNLNQNEGLSAISLLKRLYKNEVDELRNFPSTAEIALMDLIQTIEDSNDSKAKSALQIIKKCNDQFLYEENLRDETTFIKLCNDNNQKLTRTYILEQHQIIKEKAQKKDFVKYYAIIAFDADSMGEWLSGERIKDKTQLRTFHEELSKNLLAFGKEAKEYLDSGSKGRAVYAGGDDFLGFVNLKQLFPVMRELRKMFKILVSDEVKSFFENPTDEITFSAGVVVAHYKMPMGEVLNWAKRMEHEAKELDKVKKDAFAVAVLKKSGEIIIAKSKWQDAKGNYLTDSFDYLYKELEKGKDTTKKEGFSPTFIKNLNRELDIFSEDLRIKKAVPLADMIHTEMKRLTERACNIENKEAKKDAVVSLNNHLQSLFENSKYAEKSKVDNFLQTLNLSDFLTRKITQ